MMPQHLQKRMKLIEKIDKNGRYKPTEQELENAYGYLDNCFCCGKRFFPLEAFSHGFEGNCHKFGCSFFMRSVSFIYTFFLIPIKLVLLLIATPFYFIWILTKKVFQNERKN